jgi:biopolymer transport protein ExbD
MQTTGDNTSGEPMLDINVTPLIDVMLVLLIMFIITIPIQTHAVKPRVGGAPKTGAQARTTAPSEPVRTPTPAK